LIGSLRFLNLFLTPIVVGFSLALSNFNFPHT